MISALIVNGPTEQTVDTLSTAAIVCWEARSLEMVLVPGPRNSFAVVQQHDPVQPCRLAMEDVTKYCDKDLGCCLVAGAQRQQDRSTQTQEIIFKPQGSNFDQIVKQYREPPSNEVGKFINQNKYFLKTTSREPIGLMCLVRLDLLCICFMCL
jgi:hypothetical protein